MNETKAITIADNEEYLRQISLLVDIQNDKNLQNDIAILDKFCKNSGVLAMAAVQLGIPKRIIYLKNTNLEIVQKMQTNSATKEEENHNEAKILINPIIIRREGLTEYWENCASCLNNCGRVLRPYKIELEYENIEGKKQNITFEGFESTVLSHEYDHLDGILHIDIAEEIKIMPKEERKIWRQTHDYNIISKNGNYEELKNNMKTKTKKLLKDKGDRNEKINRKRNYKNIH